jgi:hypothetical protein
MTVDFNNLRKQTAYSYDRLVRTLNRSIVDKDWQPSVSVEVDDIQEDLDDLRRLIVSLCCVYQPDSEDFKSVIDDVQPLACFNEEQ